MSHCCHERQLTIMKVWPKPLNVVVETSIDETEMDLFVCEEKGKFSVMMIQAAILWRFGLQPHEVKRESIVLPPVVIRDTGTSTLYKALMARSTFLPRLPAQVQTTYILNSDSAKACVKLGRVLDAKHRPNAFATTMHSKCMMHMFWSSLTAMLNVFGVVPAVFCATVLLHRANRYRSLRAAVTETLRQKLVVVHRPPPPEHRVVNKAIVELLEWTEDACEMHVVPRRAQHRRELLRLCPRSCLQTGGLEHYCPAGCCASFEESASKVTAAFFGGYLDVRPTIPALNKWTKLFQPVSWWAFGIMYGGIIPEAFQKLTRPDPSAEDIDGVLNLVGHDGVGLDVGRAAYQALESVRYKKAVTWLRDEWTKLKVTVPTLVMKVSLRTMGRFFEDSSVASSAYCASVIPFCWHSTSPAFEAIQTYARLLANMDDEYWLPVSGVGWTHTTLRMCSHATLVIMGHVYMKCYQVFQTFPWVLARLVHASATEASKIEAIEGLFSLNDCCADEYTLHIKRWAVGLCGDQPNLDTFANVLRSEQCLRKLHDDFSMCPSSNVKTEYRFARCNRHNASAAGHHPCASTLASDHVLSEFEVQHAMAKQRLLSRPHPSHALLNHIHCLL